MIASFHLPLGLHPADCAQPNAGDALAASQVCNSMSMTRTACAPDARTVGTALRRDYAKAATRRFCDAIAAGASLSQTRANSSAGTGLLTR